MAAERQVKLYYSNGSPFARKVRIVLAELGLPYESDINDNLRPVEGMLGPTLAVPVLEDGGLTLWESDLVVDYLLTTYGGAAKPAGDPPLAPWLARPEHRWEDQRLLATIATYAGSMINLRMMLVDGLTPDNSDYLARQRARAERCLDWLEARVTPEGFLPGWFSIPDIAFICPTVFCEARGVMPWRGRPGLEKLFDRCRTRPSMMATEINVVPPMRPRYIVERRPAAPG